MSRRLRLPRRSGTRGSARTSRIVRLPRRALAAVGRVATMRRKGDVESPFAFLKDFRRIGPYLRPYRRLAITSLVLMVASAGMALLAPWPLAILLDTVLGEEPLPSLLGWLEGLSTYELLGIAVAAGLVFTALEHGLAVVDNYVNTKLDQSMVLDLRSQMFRHAQGLSMAYHDSKQMGKLMFQINTQASSVGAVTVSIPPLLQSVLTLVGMFVVVVLIQPTLALLALTVVPFIYCSAGVYTRYIEPRVYHVRRLEGDSLAIVHEAMAMLRVIVAFGRERHEYGRFRRQGEEAVSARVHLTVRQTIFTLVVTMITAIGTALVLGFGAHHVLQNDMTVGELVVVMGYIASIYKPLEQISTTFSSLQQAFISLRSAFDLLETEPEIEERPDALPLERVRGAIAFEHVDFAYRGRRGTLKDVTFEVAPGQCVAIVGPTGAGKSTLLSLLTRFYDPASGRVLLDGHDVRDLQLQGLRAQISVVLQEPLLFSASISDNIRYGRLTASDEEVEAAARAANAHDFVSALPKGYETRLGERGALLSGGERQRISVARAFLKDAPVLILDEPTSSIDSKTEAVILDALARLIRGRTTFVVAHRLSTVRDANLILVVDAGQVVEQGTHAELLARGGLYAELHDAQRGAPVPDAPVTLQPEAIAELRELATRRIRKDDPLEPAIRAARRVLGDLGLWEPPEQPHLSIVAGGER
ncbi:MAG TPA: ABC transporter ATP-binding protein [Conexibacter sp.]|nr:ABC transporter ATP-binding protein [Conexibacter sp.]